MEGFLGFLSDLILLTFGLIVLIFWIVVLIFIAIELYDLVWGDRKKGLSKLEQEQAYLDEAAEERDR